MKSACKDENEKYQKLREQNTVLAVNKPELCEGVLLKKEKELKYCINTLVPICLWATKKIFLPFLRMNSNSYITVRF